MSMVLMAFAAVAVVVVVVLVRVTAQQKPAPDWATSASPVAVHTDLLKRRYANGEMDREEYLKRLSDLSDA